MIDRILYRTIQKYKCRDAMYEGIAFYFDTTLSVLQ